MSAYDDRELPSCLLWSYTPGQLERSRNQQGFIINTKKEGFTPEFWDFINAYFDDKYFSDCRTLERKHAALSKEPEFLEICKAAGIDFEAFKNQYQKALIDLGLMRDAEREAELRGITIAQQGITLSRSNIPSVKNSSVYSKRYGW